MPFALKRKKDPADKAGDAADTAGGASSSIKSNAKAMGFEEASKALMPDKDPGKKTSVSLRHMLHVGQKDADPKTQRAVTAAVGPVDRLLAVASNFQNRTGSFLEDARKDGASPAVIARVEKFRSLNKKMTGKAEKVVAAHQDFMKRGFVTPLKAAIEDLFKVALELRLLLTGLPGPGDSVAEGGLLVNILKDAVDGVQLGARDEAAGKTLTGTQAPVSDAAVPLPLSGGSGHGLWSRALRNYADDFIVYFDAFAASAKGL